MKSPSGLFATKFNPVLGSAYGKNSKQSKPNFKKLFKVVDKPNGKTKEDDGMKVYTLKQNTPSRKSDNVSDKLSKKDEYGNPNIVLYTSDNVISDSSPS